MSRHEDAGQVLLVGGATRMPGFQRLVQNMTGIQPREYVVDPDEVPPAPPLYLKLIHPLNAGALANPSRARLPALCTS